MHHLYQNNSGKLMSPQLNIQTTSTHRNPAVCNPFIAADLIIIFCKLSTELFGPYAPVRTCGRWMQLRIMFTLTPSDPSTTTATIGLAL